MSYLPYEPEVTRRYNRSKFLLPTEIECKERIEIKDAPPSIWDFTCQICGEKASVVYIIGGYNEKGSPVEVCNGHDDSEIAMEIYKEKIRNG